MTLPISPPISFAQANVELGRAPDAPISLGEAAVRSLAGKPSGPISLADLLGKSSVRFDPDGGSVTGENYATVSVTLTCTVPATWTWARTSGAGGADRASGTTSTSITFTVVAARESPPEPARTTTAGTFTCMGTVGGITRNFTISLTARGDD